jgi:SAM-dependent methyltransferase
LTSRQGNVSRVARAGKRLLLPFWNTGHRLAWRLGEHLDAIRHCRYEHCDVCGRFGPMLYRRWIIPPRLVGLWGISERQAAAFARKESCACAGCGATLRARRLARMLLDLYPVGQPPTAARSIAAWVRAPEARALCVAEINRIEGLHDVLAALPNVAASDFAPGASRGAIVNGVRNEDLTRLTYPDDSFDVVLTSETLEHVPDLDAALLEIRRVLVPGGRHLCTVPFLPGVARTFARTALRPDGRLDHVAPPIRHPGGDAGFLVFTEIGADFPEILRSTGFEVEVAFGPATDDDLAQVYISRKMEP